MVEARKVDPKYHFGTVYLQIDRKRAIGPIEEHDRDGEPLAIERKIHQLKGLKEGAMDMIDHQNVLFVRMRAHDLLEHLDLPRIHDLQPEYASANQTL